MPKKKPSSIPLPKPVRQPPALSRRLAKAVNSPAFQALPSSQQTQVRQEMQQAQSLSDLSEKAKAVVRQAERDKKE
jgi:hypothetical protein